MPGRERRSSRRMDEDEDDTGPSRSRRTRRSASSVESDEEDELVPSRRSSRARKAIKDSDQEDEAQMSDEEESDDARGKRGKKRAKAAQDDGEWDEEEDNDDDEEDDWVRDAKEVLGKLKKNRDCQNIFFEPVRTGHSWAAERVIVQAKLPHHCCDLWFLDNSMLSCVQHCRHVDCRVCG